MLKGKSSGIASQNLRDLRKQGISELRGTKMVMKEATNVKPVKKHPNRHKNLGAFLHKGKGLPTVGAAPVPVMDDETAEGE